MIMNIVGFTEERILGQGSYGKVYKAMRHSDGRSYAIKVVNLAKLSSREMEDAVNEIRIMASFSSPFIIGFYEAFCDQRRLCIVSEYAQLGDLYNLIQRRKRKNRPLSESVIWRFLIQILEGLRELHAAKVVHRDLKSANILLAAPDLLKIGDLGVSTVLHTHQLARTQIGTPLYIAPEVWRRRPYNYLCDLWSLGVLLYEMMTFKFPFNARTTQDLARRICVGHYSLPSHGYSAELVSVLRRLLQVKPVHRGSAEDILGLQCVQERMGLLDHFTCPSDLEDSNETELLSTIKVPLNNIRFAHFPRPLYGRRNVIVKPIAERLHLKIGAPFRGRDVAKMSTPELRMVTDEDWWSPEQLETARRAAPVGTSDSKITERSSDEEDMIPAKMPPVEQQKIRPREPIIRNDVHNRGMGGHGEVWRNQNQNDVVVANKPIRPREEAVFVQKELRPDLFDFRARQAAGHNHRFGRI
jgi:NIMA (never in mitosis gene a)-related kinase